MRRRLLLAAVALLAACADDPATAPSTATNTTTVPSSTTAPAAARPHTVERLELLIEDTSRSTAASAKRGVEEKPTRTLPVLVLAPEGDGPFPIVVYSHGIDSSGPASEPLLTAIAEAGYVAVAPTFPLSSAPNGEFSDYVNQPGDVYFTLDSVIDALDDRVDADKIALVGHSLGAMTTYGAAYNSCCADPRIDAAVLMAGVEAPFPDGDYEPRPDIPLLLAHGDADATIPSTGSDDLFSRATGPVAFVRFPSGTHSSIVRDPDGEITRSSIVAWLDRWLLDDPGAIVDLTAAVDGGAGAATLQTRDL